MLRVSTPYENGDDWGMVSDCFTHINPLKVITHEPTKIVVGTRHQVLFSSSDDDSMGITNDVGG